jgi:CDGSH-type Zn-finger protein/uncharacterized Fe-S cluster protein YjdI
VPQPNDPAAARDRQEPEVNQRRRLLKGSVAAGLSALAGGTPVQAQGADAPSAEQDVPRIGASEGNGKVTATKGRALTVYFEAKRCIHARFCVLGSPAVFLANVEGEWIKPDAESVDDLIHTIRQCPSGALAYRRHDGGAEEAAPPVNLVRMRENGPLAVHADLRLKGSGNYLRATLCRCGASANKPFCDNSHKKSGFAASGEAAPGKETVALTARNGPLTVIPTTDGPYAVAGSMEVCTGTGATIARTTGAILCRCGGSKNKPFCDGTHAVIGFKAPGAENA